MAFVAKMVTNFAKKKVQDFVKGLEYLRTHEVVVGVTEESNSEHGALDCATLLYLMESGVPSKRIPARPVIEPALSQKEVKDVMKKHMRSAMFKALVKGDLSGCEAEYNKAGMAGRDGCKKYITDGTHLAPNAPSTIARKGSSTPLIDTGALLNSISYEIRGK